MKVTYYSFRGLFADNPRALYEELAERDGRAHAHTWLCTPQTQHMFPPEVETVRYGTPEARAALEQADLVIANDCISMPWTKRPGSRYLQTWHGTPLKRIHHDVQGGPEGWLTMADLDVARWDLLLSPNSATTERLRKAFGYTGPVHETGYPRNDLLSSPRRDEVRAKVRAGLGIGAHQTAVLYTPTWRDDLVFAGDGRPEFEFPIDLDQFSARLGQDHVLLLRLHSMVAGRMPIPPGAPVIDVSDHPDVRDLYLAADLMVTDYSSTMFDFAITGKPLLFFTYDLERYRDRLRGFYFDLAEVAPGPLVSTSTELVEAIADIDAVTAEHAERYARFRETFCHLEDGAATRRVLDLILPAATAAVQTTRPTLREMTSVRTGGRVLEPVRRRLSPYLTRTPAGRQSASSVQTVILAAGMGTRLGRQEPKPLTRLNDGRSILQRQLEGLRAVLGADVSITAVVGYRSDLVMQAAPDLLFAYNPDFAVTNTSKSLLRALRTTRAGGVLWLNGDVVFDPAVLEQALPHLAADQSFVCVDTNTVADEEVKYTLDGDGYIRELSKTVRGGLGEAVGINYVSAADKATLIEYLDACSHKDYFERGIETAIAERGLRVRAVDISGYDAVEVDFEGDLVRANTLLGGEAPNIVAEIA
ncbi:CDP-glycerol glycerophosphotransferase family protein [Blastococcus saxobsidens]|uniref:CDP-glycerol:poly(Glycerophosphate) glycerophosphotransferase (Modular protein) n=1 Tax=Blastococcus saxobsidens (strain DD2) TaxID=1146883 RepID=H6RVE4_BLASD|nr:CDP-glycerol glycerophosphotransferase family protein [Blastococcus saxobsidens]CCG02021.1 CDP-glycerol:poly(Glycerophosphate) glycerophosphotransferase (modular protein) [Blastococcus saxobsidens DD2]